MNNIKNCFAEHLLWYSAQAQGSGQALKERTMIHGKDTYFKQIETTQL